TGYVPSHLSMRCECDPRRNAVASLKRADTAVRLRPPAVIHGEMPWPHSSTARSARALSAPIGDPRRNAVASLKLAAQLRNRCDAGGDPRRNAVASLKRAVHVGLR